MPTLAFPVADVIQRLQGTEPIQLVGLAADLNAALATPPRNAPAVYVLSSTKGGAIKFTGSPTQQDRETTLILVVWVRHHGEPAAVRAQMDQVLAAIDQRFTGWSPGDAYEALTFAAARDEFSHAQYLVVQALYTSRWRFSARPQP